MYRAPNMTKSNAYLSQICKAPVPLLSTWICMQKVYQHMNHQRNVNENCNKHHPQKLSYYNINKSMKKRERILAH